MITSEEIERQTKEYSDQTQVQTWQEHRINCQTTKYHSRTGERGFEWL